MNEHLIPILFITHGIAFMLGGIYYVNVYIKAYDKAKRKNRQLLESIKSSFK